MLECQCYLADLGSEEQKSSRARSPQRDMGNRPNVAIPQKDSEGELQYIYYL